MRLEVVEPGSYSLTLAFEGESRITSEHVTEVISPDGRLTSHDAQSPSKAAASFACLVGKRVARLEREELALSLLFEDGSRVRVHTQIGPYESGQISRSASEESKKVVFVF